MPSNGFDRDILRVVVAQICHSLGWNSMHKSSLSVLTDILERYMGKLTKVTAGYCHNALHSEITLEDLGIAFDQLGVQICELEDYVHQVEPIHLSKPVAQFKESTRASIQFPSTEEITNREEWYEEHLPTLGKPIISQNEETKTEEDKDVTLPTPTEPVLPSNNVIAASPVALPMKRPLDSPPFSPIEAKRLAPDGQLFSPGFSRPDLPRIITRDIRNPSEQSPNRGSEHPMYPPLLSPNLQRQAVSESAIRKILEKKTVRPSGDLNSPLEIQRREAIASPNRPKVSSPFQESSNIHLKEKEGMFKDNRNLGRDSSRFAENDSRTIKDEPRSVKGDSRNSNFGMSPHMSSPLEKQKIDSPKTLFSPLRSPNLFTSPRSEPGASLNSPLPERLQTVMNKASPVIQSPEVNLSPKVEASTPKVDKKPKKAKKAKKAKKGSPSKPAEKKSKTPAIGLFQGSQQLFASPHILKSPQELKPAIVSQASVRSSPKVEPKHDITAAILSPQRQSTVGKAKGTPTAQSKPTQGSPHQQEETPTTNKKTKTKKGKKRQSENKPQKSDSSLNLDSPYEPKEKIPRMVAENRNELTSPPWKQQKATPQSEFKSPQSITSSPLKSPKYSLATTPSTTFSVSTSQSPGLSSPVTPKISDTSPETSKKEKAGKEKGKKKEDKKRKKEKKNKKKEEEIKQKEVESAKAKKIETPSLKLTFKRAPSGAFQDQTPAPSSGTKKVHDISPTFSSPIETPSPQITSKKFEQKSRKPAKKKKSLATPVAKEKKLEPAVRIEPLVVNDVFSDPEEDEEIPESPKKAEKKRGSPTKKESTGKKGRPPKKSDSGKKAEKKPEPAKKTSAKKAEKERKSSESTRKNSSSKSSDVYQPDQYFSSPTPTTPIGEQSVSRGLFVQTITEPGITESGYSPHSAFCVAGSAGWWLEPRTLRLVVKRATNEISRANCQYIRMQPAATTAQVWYCPACLRPDDGSPMIGCDSCDGWYHWPCVGITQAPGDDVEWYCETCVDRLSKKKTKKRKKKD